MLSKALASALLMVSGISADATARSYSTIQPSLTDVEAAAATATTNHITSDVKGGKLFDRFVVIWLENTDFDKAYDNDDMQWLSQFGIVLTNNWGLSHPSQENYLGSAGGDYLGLGTDDFVRVPSNVSTVVDLLDTKGISWAEYQEHMPYSGYEGFQFLNQESDANDYVRKHNPLILYDSVTEDPSRLGNIKNFTEFYNDLDSKTLPQWMFITPNMTNDGHDSTIAVASKWSRDFLTPLLNDSYFMENTLILLTFDETETYTIPNKIFGLLLGGALADSQRGTEDDTYYDHYSELSTVEDNWDLPHLGRFDVDSNVYSPLANISGWENKVVDTSNLFNNESYDGYFSDETVLLPVPNCDVINQAGQGILPAVESIWSVQCHSENSYTASFATSAPSSVVAFSTSSAEATSTPSVTTTITSTGTIVGKTTSGSKTASTVPVSTATSTPLCSEIGTDITSFLDNLEKYFGSEYKSLLQNPTSIRSSSELPLCKIIKEGEEIIEDILAYLESLEASIFTDLFKESTVSNSSNSSSNSTTSTSASQSTATGAAASVYGIAASGLMAGLMVLMQLI